jgi:hypothetical protein
MKREAGYDQHQQPQEYICAGKKQRHADHGENPYKNADYRLRMIKKTVRFFHGGRFNKVDQRSRGDY